MVRMILGAVIAGAMLFTVVGSAAAECSTNFFTGVTTCISRDSDAGSGTTVTGGVYTNPVTGVTVGFGRDRALP